MIFSPNQELKKFTLIAVAFCMIMLTASAGEEKLGSLSTEDLISKLTDESNPGIGSHSTAWADGFMAMEDEPTFSGGILGSEKPITSPVMRELVRRGLKAFPTLLDHLTDARPTKLTVGEGFTGKWFSNEYDPRYKDPKKQPSNVNINNWGGELPPAKDFTKYTLKVGDLCFVAIGQIVNRNLNAIRYQPSMCLVVNSPVETPALAIAVRKDWSNLTPKEHQESLISDINRAVFDSPAEGLKRLWFYYPKIGETWIIKMLQRPVYDRDLAVNFFEKTLVPAASADEAVSLLKKFREQHGDTNYIGVLRWLVWTSNLSEAQLGNDDQRRAERLVAIQLLKRMFSDFAPSQPPFLNAVEISEQRKLFEELNAIHFPQKDKTTFHFLQDIISKNPGHDSREQEDRCRNALALSQGLSSVETYKSVFHDTIYKLLTEYQDLSKAETDAKTKAYYDQWIAYLQSLLK